MAQFVVVYVPVPCTSTTKIDSFLMPESSAKIGKLYRTGDQHRHSTFIARNILGLVNVILNSYVVEKGSLYSIDH